MPEKNTTESPEPRQNAPPIATIIVVTATQSVIITAPAAAITTGQTAETTTAPAAAIITVPDVITPDMEVADTPHPDPDTVVTIVIHVPDLLIWLLPIDPDVRTCTRYIARHPLPIGDPLPVRATLPAFWA